MRNRFSFFGAATALLLSNAALAIAQDVAKEITLTRTVKAGDTVRQKSTITLNAGGMELNIVQTEKRKVKEIDKKGNIVWTSEMESVTVNDMEQPNPGIVQTETRDKFNKLVESKPLEGAENPFSPEMQKLMSSTSEIILSEKPVKAGAAWTTELENPVVKDKKVTIKTTFVGLEKVEGKDYWKLKQTVEAATDNDGGKTSMDVTALLDPVDGSMQKMDVTVKDLPTNFGSLSWTMKMEKLKADKAPKP